VGEDARAFALEVAFKLVPGRSKACLAQPLVALREHGGDERGGGLDVVVEVQEEPARRRGKLIDRSEGSFPVVLVRVLDDAGLGAEARHHRHLARERGAEGVDGLDAETVGDSRVLYFFQNPFSHLGRGLDGEGYGDDLLGLLHRLEERDEALDQELGLARAGGRLDDERAPRVERGCTGSFVGDRGYHQATGAP
jgi:hypothetical protein